MASALFIVAQQGYRDIELLEPLRILRQARHACTIASIQAGKAHGADGHVADVVAVTDVSLDEFDVVIVIGGPGAPALADHEEVLELLRDAQARHKKLAAICIAPTVLAKAGVLRGHHATVFETPESRKILERGGAIFVGRPVVLEPGLVTGNGPRAATEFGRKVAEMLRA